MSKIEWTDQTWNPWTGCTKVSPGCDHCYMYRDYPRLREMGNPGYQNAPDLVRVALGQLEKPRTWRKPRMVFVCSMSDFFHPAVPPAVRLQVFQLMTETAESQGHIYQLLTKRPGLAAGFWQAHQEELGEWHPNIWLGTSVENQKYAPRLTVLARAPAKVRFVSAEPLLGPVDIEPWLQDQEFHWIICGGESGPEARPMATEWARSLRDQARRSGVPFFLKQLGGRRDKRGGPKAVLDGQRWQEMPAPGQQLGIERSGGASYRAAPPEPAHRT